MFDTDESRLLHKLKLIQALFAGAATPGERDAAAAAKQRLLERLNQRPKEEPVKEYTFTMGDGWNKKLFTALLRRYGLSPYRYRGQRRTTVMVRVTKGFVDDTLWPEYRKLAETLHEYLEEVTDKVIREAVYYDSSDAEEVPETRRIGVGV